MQDPTRPCPVCGAASAPIGSKSGHSILECPACSLRFTVPPAQDPRELYGERYFTSADAEYGNYLAEEGAHRRQARRYLKHLRLLHAAGTLLDVGGAAGFFADEARKQGWSTRIIEVSPYAADCAAAIGVTVIRGAFPDVDTGPGKYDVVTFFNSLEHFPEPRRVEARLQELVKPGGFLVIETWDWRSLVARVQGLQWHQYHPEYVPHYFDRRSLLTLFCPADWQLIEYRRATKWISVRRALDILGSKHGAAAFRILGRGPIGLIDVPYRMGDLIWVSFRRPDHRGTLAPAARTVS